MGAAHLTRRQARLREAGQPAGSRSGKAHGLAGRHVDAAAIRGAQAQLLLEFVRTLRQHRESAPVHGDDALAAEQRAGLRGLPGIHGKDAAHGQERHVQRIELPPEGHAAEQTGIPGMIDREPVGRTDDVARRAAGFAGMEGRDHGHGKSGVLHRAAHVEAYAVEQLGLRQALRDQLFRRAHDGPEHGSGLVAEGHGVAHMVRVIVRHQHDVQRAQAVRIRTGGGRQEGVDAEAAADAVHLAADDEGRVAVPGDAAHGCSLCAVVCGAGPLPQRPREWSMAS